MVTVLMAVHPDGSTYDIDVVPLATPVTSPAVPMVATAVLLLLQVPPEVLLLRVMVLLSQARNVVPVIAVSGLHVSVNVDLQPVGSV